MQTMKNKKKMILCADGKEREEVILDVANLISDNSTIKILGPDAPELGEFINGSNKLEIRATRHFKSEYNNHNRDFIRSEINEAINKVKKLPTPPQRGSDDWKTLDEIRIQSKNKYKIGAVHIIDEYRLTYVYIGYKERVNNTVYNATKVILTNCGNHMVFDYYYGDTKVRNKNLRKKFIKESKFFSDKSINLNNKIIRKMNLELNLVKTQSIYSRVSSLIARKRVKVDNDNQAMDAIMAFIADNMITFNAAITNKALVNQLPDLKSLTIDELYSLKYIIALSGGIDLIITVVSDNEVNEYDIPDGVMEYNVIDNLRAPLGFIKFATKIPLSNKGNLTELYTKITEMYGLFDGNLFRGTQNPLEYQLGILRQTEKAFGVTPSTITTYLNSVIEYLGKDIYVIMP